jgi:hypothetical protein
MRLTNVKEFPTSNRQNFLLVSLALLLVTLLSAPAWADVDKPTKFPTSGGIVNSRHNLTQTPIGGGFFFMESFRNNYGEVCVYCHTPHGAGTALQAPLWNRTNTNTSGYVTYNTLGTASLTGNVTTPGPASLTCLSCHDGTVAVDSIINMPGSGPNTYLASQETGTNLGFLDSWTNASGTSPSGTSHMSLSSTGCLVCHAPGAPAGANATDLTVQALGTDFRDDHPIGVPFKGETGDPDYQVMTATNTQGNLRFFDLNGNARPDKNEIRAFKSDGTNFEVECASCHDPHGVEVGTRLPTFLRVSNAGSGVCLTCHIK